MHVHRPSNPRNATAPRRRLARTSLVSSLSLALLAWALPAAAADDDFVLIQGITIDEERLFATGPGDFGWTIGPDQLDQWREAACDPEVSGSAVQSALAVGIEAYARGTGISEGEALEQATPAIRAIGGKFWKEQSKCRNTRQPIKTFNIVYASCAMYMQQNGQQMLITLPPSTNGAVMQLRAPGERPMMIDLNNGFARTGNLAKMDKARVKLSLSGNRGTHLGVATREYHTYYQATSNMNMLAGMNLPGMGKLGEVKVVSSGKAWIAQDVPGLDVVRAFYRNFAAEVRAPGIANAFLNGLVEQMARITDKGMPLLLEQTISSGTRTPMAFIGRSGTSLQVITGIGALPRSAAPPAVATLCNSSLIRKGEKFEDLGQMMAGLPAGTPPSGKARTETQRAMEEAAKALQGLDPATRAMMEKMGIPLPGMGNTGQTED